MVSVFKFASSLTAFLWYFQPRQTGVFASFYVSLERAAPLLLNFFPGEVTAYRIDTCFVEWLWVNLRLIRKY